MRITNKDYGPLEVFDEILKGHATSAAATARFAETDLSNHNFVLLELRERLDTILKLFERFGCDTIEMQGPTDEGIDLLWRFAFQEKSVRIAIQVKSNREADDESVKEARVQKVKADPESTIFKTLKRDAFEAFRGGRIDQVWILPCFNHGVHRKRLNGINAYFELKPNSNQPIRVLGPQQVLGFLQLSTEEIEATCVRLLCRDDEVLRSASSALCDLPLAARTLVRQSFFPSLEDGTTVSYDDISSAIDEAGGDADEKTLLSVVDSLERIDYLSRDHLAEDDYTVNPLALPGLCALHFEGRVRHDLSSHDADAFTWELLSDCFHEDEE